MCSFTCNREHSIEAAISVRQMQPITHLDLMPLAPGKVHQGATHIASQLEHFLVDVEILAIATTLPRTKQSATTQETDHRRIIVSLDLKYSFPFFKGEPTRITQSNKVRHKKCINEDMWSSLLLKVTPTDVCDNAPRLQVQQELSNLWPGFIAAVIEIGSDLVIDTVHMVSLELAGSLLHHVCPCSGLTASCLQGQTHLPAHFQIINPSDSSCIS